MKQLLKSRLRSFGWLGQKMSDWNLPRIDNRCNSPQYNAIHNRSGFQRQFSLHSTGNQKWKRNILSSNLIKFSSIDFDIEMSDHVLLFINHHPFQMCFFFTFQFVVFRFMLDNYQCTMKRLALKLPNKQLPKKLYLVLWNVLIYR